jgi:hypothetical protein
MNKTVVYQTPDQILAFSLLAMRSALKLEILGMRNSRASVAKSIRRLTGTRTQNKQKLLAEYENLLKHYNFIK